MISVFERSEQPCGTKKCRRPMGEKHEVSSPKKRIQRTHVVMCWCEKMRKPFEDLLSSLCSKSAIFSPKFRYVDFSKIRLRLTSHLGMAVWTCTRVSGRTAFYRRPCGTWDRSPAYSARAIFGGCFYLYSEGPFRKSGAKISSLHSLDISIRETCLVMLPLHATYSIDISYFRYR